MIQNSQTAHVVHYVFEWLALAVGLAVYRAGRRKSGVAGLTSQGSFAVLIGCLIGAALGNKLAYQLENPDLWSGSALGLQRWLAGQSLVGALLGGWLGVEIGKRIAGITARTGDDYVPAILAGIALGRIGCFLAGLHDGTFGLPTGLPWGVDFGDGVSRHPTQLYESLLALLALVAWPWWRQPFAASPGLAFRVLMLGYLLWRLEVDTIKPVVHAYTLGWSGLQWLCAVGIVVITTGLAMDARRRNACLIK